MSFQRLASLTVSRSAVSTSSKVLRALPRPAAVAPSTGSISARALASRSYSSIPPRVPETEAAPVVAPQPRFRKWRTRFARATLVTVVGAIGGFIYLTQKDLYPGEQLEQDPTKKTIVVLGNGWGATSFLKQINTDEYNVVVISPRNYFLFTPLLPSVTVGTLEARSIIQPTRFITRHKTRKVRVYEAEAKEVDPVNKTVTFEDISEITPTNAKVSIKYDYLVYAVGCDNQTFGMPGVPKYACFLKELDDANKIRRKLLDCIETAAFQDQTEEEIDRLMHMVVVGGGPTGVEYAGELHDFLIDDLRRWYPEVADRLRITLIEALPNVLPAFSKQLINYTESTFKENKIDVMTRTMVKDVKEKSVVVQDANKEMKEIPYGLLVWATGNTSRGITRDLMNKLPEHQTVRRGLAVDDYMHLLGAEGVYALGDCTATDFAPTAQVATQQGLYLAKVFEQLASKHKLENKLTELRASGAPAEEVESVVKRLNRAGKMTPFHYSHQGSLAYIGSDKAIADLPLVTGNVAIGGALTYWFWRSAYISTLYSIRNRSLVIADWTKVKLFGRDVSRE